LRNGAAGIDLFISLQGADESRDHLALFFKILEEFVSFVSANKVPFLENDYHVGIFKCRTPSDVQESCEFSV
jgi:hypothetical protein